MADKPRLLFIDDEASFLFLLDVYFSSDGTAQVFTASRAEDARRLAAEMQPDYVFIDTIMPRVDGENLVRELKAAAPEAKLISLSGLPRFPEWADASFVKSGEVLEKIKKL